MESGSNSSQPSVLCREIHKNGILKKYNSEKRTGFPRKSERVWAVFCVHDDSEAFLEFYLDQRMALNHKPDWFVSLHNIHHISPSICASSDEYEFAVTLPTQVVRLAATTWETMMEWVETIRNKLRELRVLAPKENVYSKMPEPRPGLLPTRDPTSPLPLPPVGPRTLVPGVESPVRSQSTAMSTTQVDRPVAITSTSQDSSQVETSSNNNSDGNPRRRAHPSSSESLLGLLHLVSSSDSDSSRHYSEGLDDSHEVKISSVNSTQENSNMKNVKPDDDSYICRRNSGQSSSGNACVVVVSSENSESNYQEGDRESVEPMNSQPHHNIPMALPSTSNANVTVIEVPPPQSPHYEQLFIPNPMQCPNVADVRTKLERLSTSGLIPRVPSRPKREAPDEPRTARQVQVMADNAGTEAAKIISSPGGESHQHKSIVRVKSFNEHSPQTSVVRVVPGNGISVLSVAEEPLFSASASHDSVPPLAAAFQPAPSNLDVKDIPLIGGHQRRRRRSSSSDSVQGPVIPRSLGGADLIRTVPAEAPETVATALLTLRESQVCQLQKEISHPGGVRLKLRRRDCLNAIALVDICNSVWIAGWKQKEHPLLYNALHIGDELLSVGDSAVLTAADAQKLLKGPAAAMVELVVRRLPLGRVFTLIRARREGDVGLKVDTTVPGEVTVEPGGIAARAGLPLCAPTMDGLALTTWTLTEVNGRPLNLFCKSSDVTTRLNSVGKELSILVQPSDFIKQLRKQLKNIRGYKDYLLQ